MCCNREKALTKEELRSIPRRHMRIERDKKHLEYLREKATSVKSGTPSDVKVQVSVVSHDNHYVLEAVDLSRDIERREKELNRLKADAASLAKQQEDRTMRRLIELRYVECLTWDDVADLLGYHIRQVHRFNEELLNSLRH